MHRCAQKLLSRAVQGFNPMHVAVQAQPKRRAAAAAAAPEAKVVALVARALSQLEPCSEVELWQAATEVLRLAQRRAGVAGHCAHCRLPYPVCAHVFRGVLLCVHQHRRLAYDLLMRS